MIETCIVLHEVLHVYRELHDIMGQSMKESPLTDTQWAAEL